MAGKKNKQGTQGVVTSDDVQNPDKVDGADSDGRTEDK